MNAAVLHHSLNRPGGETTVALQIIDSLQYIGYNVKLISVEKLDHKSVATAYGKQVLARNSRYLIPFKLGYFGLYQRFLTCISSLALHDIDLVINTNGTVLPLKIPKNVPSILYVHFPTALLNVPSYVHNDKYQKSLFWKMYFKPYRILANILTRRALSGTGTVVVNSYFTKNAITRIYPKIDPEVLYPCVELERFSVAYNSRTRNPQVIVISRFSPEKQIERAIEIAKIMQNIKFEVVGSLNSTNHRYFNSLNEMIERYGLQDRVKLRPNLSFTDLLLSMSISKIYLHTTFGEHFGVSIIEAMAAGLIPVVPAVGGCTEIVPPKYQYHGIEDAADCITKFIREYDDDKRKEVYKIAEKFSLSSFKERLRQLIQESRNKCHQDQSSNKRVT